MEQFTNYQLEQIMNIIDPQELIEHILGRKISTKVIAAMQLSHDMNGVLSQEDINFINSL